MEGLLVHVMRWGKEQGYRSFSLGMAPLSGFERSPVAPLWTRLGSFLYAHGETSTTSRACAPTRTSSIRRGNRDTSRTPAASRCRAPRRRRGADRRRLPEDLAQMKDVHS